MQKAATKSKLITVTIFASSNEQLISDIATFYPDYYVISTQELDSGEFMGVLGRNELDFS